MSRAIDTLACEQAADAILTLINSQPRTPTKAEVAAIIAQVATPTLDVGPSKYRSDWDAAMAACRAAEPVASDEEMAAASDRVDACAQRICSEPVRGLADIRLIAETCYWTWWSDPSGLTSADADAQLA